MKTYPTIPQRGRDMKTYKGYRGGDTAQPARITVHLDDGSSYPLPHVVRHSPTGFNWSYTGSGPADTALSILTDCFGREVADGLYQKFKFAFVGGWASQWEITEAAIKAWAELVLKGDEHDTSDN